MSLLSSTSKTEQEPETYRCNKCKDMRGRIQRVPLSEKPFDYIDNWEDCSCVKDRLVERLMKSSKITDEFQQKTFHNFETSGRPELIETAYKTAGGYAKQFFEIRHLRKNSLALLGRPGSGKTHLIMAVCNYLLKKGVGVQYFPWVEGFNEIKDNLDMLDTRIRQLQQAEVLFIDDMYKGRQKPTDFQAEQSFAVVNYRYLNNLPILVSSERTIAGICEIDEALGSRINEMCRDYKLVIQGGIEMNYRLK
ncbi:ATP-binding protein [Paenibacillus polysaccharolyticus]|nr:ATP-binding protein [Paenibacillus polysaccharolyticus]